MTSHTFARGFCALALLAAVPLGLAQTDFSERAPSVEPGLITIAKGLHSQFGAGFEGFDGANLEIRTPLEWRAFWALHAGNPDADPPPVDFTERVVLAAIQGTQNSTGGPNITVAGLQDPGPLRRVAVVNDRRPGPLDAMSNPFHIVSVPRSAIPAQTLLFFSSVRPALGSATLQGRVVGMTPDGDARPLVGATVRLADPATPEESVTVRTGRDGSYYFINVPRGMYVVRATAEGFQPQMQQVDLSAPGLTRQPFQLELLPGAIAGRVVTPTAAGEPAPVAGALVTAQRIGDGDDPGTWQTESGPQGGFALPALQPGRYRLLVDATGFEPTLLRVRVAPGNVTQELVVLESLK